MSTVTPQLTNEKKLLRPSRLSNSPQIDRDQFYGSNLGAAEYRAVLEHWIRIAASFPKIRGSVSSVWCREFVSRLSSSNQEFSDLVEAGMRKVSEERRIDSQFREQAGGDPLFYLNLNGVPPAHVLLGMGDIQARIEKLNRAAPLSKELETKTAQAISRLRKVVARYNEIARPSKLEEALNLLEREYSEFKTTIAAMVGLKSLGDTSKRRTPLIGEFTFAAQILRAVIYSEMNSWVRGDPEPPEREASKRELLLPIVACIMKAAWPKWFNTKDPAAVLRKVKTACPVISRKPITILLANYPNPWTVDNWCDFVKPHLAPVRLKKG